MSAGIITKYDGGGVKTAANSEWWNKPSHAYSSIALFNQFIIRSSFGRVCERQYGFRDT